MRRLPLEQSPILKQLIANRTADTLELITALTSKSAAPLPTDCEVRPTSRSSRTRLHFGTVTKSSANADTEILNACVQVFATTGGPLIIASSPYAKRGVLWAAHKQHYGKDGDPLILVAKVKSEYFNPSLPQSVVDRALEHDRLPRLPNISAVPNGLGNFCALRNRACLPR